jgi:hypothetical protein
MIAEYEEKGFIALTPGYLELTVEIVGWLLVGVRYLGKKENL